MQHALVKAFPASRQQARMSALVSSSGSVEVNSDKTMKRKACLCVGCKKVFGLAC